MTFYDVRADPQPLTPEPSGPRRRAPGKQTKTAPLPARTGFALIDDKPVCERPGAAERPDCRLTESERTRTLFILATGALTASANKRDAMQDERIELLTKYEAGWGFLEDFFFYPGSGLLIRAGLKGAMRVLGRAAGVMAESSLLDDLTLRVTKVDEAAVTGLLTNVSRGARAHIKHGRAGLPAGNDGKAAFIQQVREGDKPFVDGLVSQASAELDDDSLIALAHGYQDLSVHSVAAYRAELSETLARFSANHIDDIGETTARGKRIGQDGDVEEFQRGRLIWVTAQGKRRLGLFNGIGAGHDFQHWVDPEFTKLALGLYHERASKDPDEMTIDGLDSILTPGAKQDRAWLDDFLGDGGRT